MAYVAVSVGREAIEASIRLLDWYRSGTALDLELEAIAEKMSLLVDRVIECDGVRYYLISYGDIYFRLVNGHPEMLNGWVACEPVPDEKAKLAKRLKEIGLQLPSLSINDSNRREMGEQDKLAVVKYIGLPVKEYLDPTVEEHDAIAVGDIVILKWAANRRLEFDAGRFFGKGELIITRRPRIVGKMSEDLFD